MSFIRVLLAIVVLGIIIVPALILLLLLFPHGIAPIAASAPAAVPVAPLSRHISCAADKAQSSHCSQINAQSL